RDEEREVGVARPGLLDPAVEFVAQRLPNSESVGTEHDTSAHRRVVGEFGARDYLVVPGGEVDASRGDFLFVLFLCHAMVFQPRTIHCAACQSIAAPPLRARRAPAALPFAARSSTIAQWESPLARSLGGGARPWQQSRCDLVRARSRRG